MPIGEGARKEKQAVQPYQMGIAILALLVVIGFIAYASFKPRDEALTVPKSETTKWIEQKASETNGDIKRLSPEDQQKLQQLTHNRGEAMLKMLAPKN